MWSEKVLKIVPAILFLFCLLGIFELALIVNDMNKTEKIRKELDNDLEAINNLLNNVRRCTIENFEYKKHR